MYPGFLPVSREDMTDRGWYYYDYLLVTGDAYVDHPSFGTAVIGRVLEAEGYRVAVLAQPNWQNADDFAAMGRPRYGVFIGAGNLDSMVAHYTAAKRRRHDDAYSPGRRPNRRPDRAVIVYSNLARAAFPGIPVIIGGIEASLRRFAHYDYWDNKVRRSELFDSGADLLVYGMGELATREIAGRLAAGKPVREITDVRGTAFIADSADSCIYEYVECASYEEVSRDKRAYAEANMIQYDEHDPVCGRAVIQPSGDKLLVVNPPARPLTAAEFDAVYELPYTREVHPMYEAMGGVPAIDEVRFSVVHNRGCFGACNFCSLAFHQGRMVTSRSHGSVLREVEAMTVHPLFKGYVHDIGGPTANFRRPSCSQQLKNGMCRGRNCLAPTPCRNLDADHRDYMELLRKVRSVPGVKKVFIRSGIRFDYLMCDRSGEFFADLVKHHVSGQLKVAPEHCVDSVLDYMGKPHNAVFERFRDRYYRLNKRYGLDQYLVPYLISSHPGSELGDAVRLAEYLKKAGIHPEQVQDFYPTPGTLSTCMYYTGIDPRTMKPVYVPRPQREKAMQRALLQWQRPELRPLVEAALRESGRQDLIGWGDGCLLRPIKKERETSKGNNSGKQASAGTPARKKTEYRTGNKRKFPERSKPGKRRR